MEKKESSSVKFEKTCCIVFHNNEKVSLLYELDQRRYVTSEEREYISQNSLICSRKNPFRKHYICDNCLKTVKNKLEHPTKRQKKTLEVSVQSPSTHTATPFIVTDVAVQSIANAFESGTLTEFQNDKILQAVGRRLHATFIQTKTDCRSGRLDYMKTSNYVDVWAEETNKEWKTLITLTCGLQGHMDTTACRRLTKCTELIRSQLDSTFISNLALGEALLLMQFSHSKYAVDLFCRTNAAGSFSTVRRTLGRLGDSVFSLPRNDVCIAFDNNQVIQKTWMFKFGGKQVVSTVTTMACYDQVQDVTQHQFESSIPTALFPSESNRGLLLSRYDQLTQQANDMHRLFRRAFITSRIKKVASECIMENGQLVDSISRGTNAAAMKDEVFMYSRVPSLDSQSRVFDMECLPENPNSYRSIAVVLDTILDHLEREDGTRKYVPVYMDGAPYSICIKLVRSTYICGKCKGTVSSDDTDKHTAEKHATENATVQWSRKYKKILIRPGNGHVEMTLVKSIMSTFWVPFIKPIAALFGYNSESQLEYCRKAFDHHKSWNILMVLFAAYSDELLFPYVKYTLLKNETPSFEGYTKWESDTAKSNLAYKLAADFTFTTLNALHLFRSAIRNCNDNVSILMRHKATSLLYACNNTKYHEILCYDTSYLLSLDTKIREIVSSESTRRIGGEVGEGYDFLLENRNKLYKSFLPSDSAPSFEQWLQVTKASTELEEMRAVACKRLDLNITTSTQRNRKFEEEIFEARKYIRDSGIFMKGELGLSSIAGENIAVDDCMLNYVHLSETNRKSYYKAFYFNEKVHMPLLNVVQEIADVTTGTADNIRDALVRKLSLLREPFYSFYKGSYKKNMTKEDAVELYKAVILQIENQKIADHESLLSDAFKNYLTM